MRHIVGKLSTSSFQRYKVCANRSSDEGVMAPGSRGVGAVFVHFSGEDSGQTGDAIGEPRVPRRSRSHYLSNAPGLADQLVASRKDSAREGGFFRSGFRLDPDKFLAIREFHVVHDVSFFPMCPGSQINLLRVRKTLCASVATSVGKFRKFQHSLISSACFHARGRRSSRCRISTILVSSESLRYLLFNGTAKNLPQFACHSLSDALALNRLTHGSKVKISRSGSPFALSEVRRHVRAFGVIWLGDYPSLKSSGPTVWHLNPNTLRGDLTWGLPKLKSGGSTAWHLNPNTLGMLIWTSNLFKSQIGWFNGLEFESKHVEGDLTWGLPKSQIGVNQRFGILNPNTLRGDLTWGLPKSQIGVNQRCLTEVVVAEIVAGPHALDSCECMNIEGAMRAPFEVVVALSAGSECTRIPYFRLSYLVVSTSMSAECVYDERFPSNFLEPLNTTHGLVEPRRKNCPSIKVETGAWPSFSYGQHSTKASVWDCVWAFSGQGMLFEGSLGEKVLQHLSGFFGQWLDWWFRG
uniref:Uncharacterized protein n=1 Tax=Fagus sylvatica TaxID=28930 RepID=A0A2N9GSJ7_FAGSY